MRGMLATKAWLPEACDGEDDSDGGADIDSRSCTSLDVDVLLQQFNV